MLFILNRFLPWIITVVPPSGILINLTILATVPIFSISVIPGSSTPLSFCATTPINLSALYASFTAFILLSRPTVMGSTTPGKSTVLRSGITGNSSGISVPSLVSLSLSLRGMIGIKSISSSVRWKNFDSFIS